MAGHFRRIENAERLADQPNGTHGRRPMRRDVVDARIEQVIAHVAVQ